MCWEQLSFGSLVLHQFVVGTCDSILRVVAAAVVLAGGLQQGLQGLGAGGRWGAR
jgi:hypothetical protein